MGALKNKDNREDSIVQNAYIADSMATYIAEKR